MANSPYVFDATAENFHTLVLENSDKGPVLVNYWSPRAGPCLMLMPRLIRLATEFSGRFLLVMLNTDELGRLARDHGVTSLPTVKLFRRGEAIDTLHGAESETALREFISRHVSREADGKYAAALEAYGRGDLDVAVTRAAEAALAAPDNPRLAIDLVKLLMLQQRYSRAEELVESLPEGARNHPDIRNLSVHLGFIRAAQDAPPAEILERAIAGNPDDLDARYRLAALKITQDKYEAAMQQLLEIVRYDSNFRNRAALDGLSAIFSMLGENDERVQRCRERLNRAKNGIGAVDQ